MSNREAAALIAHWSTTHVPGRYLHRKHVDCQTTTTVEHHGQQQVNQIGAAHGIPTEEDSEQYFYWTVCKARKLDYSEFPNDTYNQP
ncbi:unnamed protein product [Amaranthus hypochondriacus]